MVPVPVAVAQRKDALLREVVDPVVDFLHPMEELVPLGLHADAVMVPHAEPAAIRKKVSAGDGWSPAGR